MEEGFASRQTTKEAEISVENKKKNGHVTNIGHDRVSNYNSAV